MTTTTGGTVVLACGGYRSGSTLQYNVVGEYAERAGIGRRIGFVEPDQAAVLPQVWSFVEALGTAVAKCADGAVDPRTLLHADHVGDPDGGGWRSWTPAERDLVRRHVEPLMERFGYVW